MGTTAGRRITPRTNPDVVMDRTQKAALVSAGIGALVMGLKFAAYWLTIKDGTITKIEEQYSP